MAAEARIPVFEARMAEAYKAGQAAVEAREPRSACPHDGDAEDPRERVLALMWLRGWTAGNPVDLDAALPE